MTEFLTITLAFLNSIFGFMMLYCSARLSWQKKSDRVTIIGFLVMMAVFFTDAVIAAFMFRHMLH